MNGIDIPEGFRKLDFSDTLKSGVYLIFRGKKIIYVGRAKRLKSRLNCHLVCRMRGFTTYIHETSNGVEEESNLIEKYKPPLNRQGGQGNLNKYGGLKRLKLMSMDSGQSLTKIALHFHVTDQTILNWINKYDLPRRYAR